MISRQTAIELLEKYEDSLNEFQSIIKGSIGALLRCDEQIIPNLLAALKAIANSSVFEPIVATGGMSTIQELDSNPQLAIHKLLVDSYFHNHFKAMCTHYAGNRPELLQNLQNFHESILAERVIDDKAKNTAIMSNLSMQVLGGFIAALGGAVVATAFVILNAATFNTLGVIVATLGVSSVLAGVGLFARGTLKNSIVQDEVSHPNEAVSLV